MTSSRQLKLKVSNKKKYKVLFQGDDVLLTIVANNISEARRVFNKQLKFIEEVLN